MKRATVMDLESAPEPGQRLRTLAQYICSDATQKAEAWIERFGQADKVARGGYGIDVSEFCFECRSYHHEDADCEVEG